MTQLSEWRGLAALALIALVVACDRPNPPSQVPFQGVAGWTVEADGRVHAHEQNTKGKGWKPVLFKEPIQGRPLSAGSCAWPSSGKLAQKHPTLSNTIGEFDPVTCAGTIYFGDWADDIRRDQEATKATSHADTAKPTELGATR